MRNMTPDWLVQLTWFAAGISATGAFWYFLGQRNYHGTLWAGYSTAVFALLAVAFLVRNDLIRREATLAGAVESRPQAETQTSPQALPVPHASGETQPTEPEIKQPAGEQQRPNQSIINSPGSIQAGRDVIISADPQLIRSIELRVAVETITTPVVAASETFDFGLGSVIALFTKDKQRFRFASDMRVFDQQVSETRRRLRFVYTPEDPTQLLGRPIALLETFDVLAINFVDIFQTEKFDTSLGGTDFECGIVVNGLPIALVRADVQPNGLLNKQQANLNVADTFSQIPAAYKAVIGARTP